MWYWYSNFYHLGEYECTFKLDVKDSVGNIAHLTIQGQNTKDVRHLVCNKNDRLETRDRTDGGAETWVQTSVESAIWIMLSQNNNNSTSRRFCRYGISEFEYPTCNYGKSESPEPGSVTRKSFEF